MISLDADVIIAGAGPAGCLAAHDLAEKGIRVLILEKADFPRYKTCGGGLTHKIIREIPFDVTPVIESTINTFRFSLNFTDIYTRETPDPLIYCTMRSDLDAWLLQKAVQKGAIVKMKEQVTGVEDVSGGVRVKTRFSEYFARLVIGSEGATGIVSRSAGLKKDISSGLAWEAEIKTDPRLLAPFSRTVFLDWGTFPGGYGWVFPKKDHFSVGVGGPAKYSAYMMPYYKDFLHYFLKSVSGKNHPDGTASPLPEYRELSLKSWPIPVRTKKSEFHKGSVLVTGDSAGLTDPLTGEGIYYAIRSGRIAAEVCKDYLEGKVSSLAPYSEKVNEELMSELLEADRVKYLFNGFSRRVHCFIRDNDRAWKAFGKILRGERWYTDIRNGFGKYRSLWSLICRLSEIVASFRRNYYRNRVGSEGLFPSLSSHTTVRAVRHTAVRKESDFK
jgi:geranylgeranyl reductase family protein